MNAPGIRCILLRMFAIVLRTAAIFLMMACGFWLRRRGEIDEDFNRKLSSVLVNVFYPALVFSALIRNLSWPELLANWLLPAGVFLIKLIGWLVGNACMPLLRGRSETTRACFRFVIAVNNYSFLPIMIVASLWGERAVALIAFAGLGAECFVWTLGLRTLTGARLTRDSLRHLLSRPILALAVALLVIGLKQVLGAAGRLPAADGSLRQVLQTGLDTCHLLGGATVPVSAVVCGCRMASIRPHHVWTRLMGGTVLLRLAVVPALSVIVLKLLPISGLPMDVLMVIAVQPAAMVSVTLAELYDRDPPFAAAVVFVTHLVCLATIPLWLHLVLGQPGAG